MEQIPFNILFVYDHNIILYCYTYTLAWWRPLSGSRQNEYTPLVTPSYPNVFIYVTSSKPPSRANYTQWEIYVQWRITDSQSTGIKLHINSPCITTIGRKSDIDSNQSLCLLSAKRQEIPCFKTNNIAHSLFLQINCLATDERTSAVRLIT